MKWYKVRIYGLLYMSSTENDHLSRFYVTCFLILGKMHARWRLLCLNHVTPFC